MGGNVTLVGFYRSGFLCTIAEHSMGFLVGEVFIPSGHPWHGVEEAWEVSDLASWSGSDDRGGPWRVGFDCGGINQRAVRRDVSHVRRRLEQLAGEAAAAKQEAA